MKRKQAKKVEKEPRSVRIGRWLGRRGPGTAKVVGRSAKRAASGAKSLWENLSDGIRQGWDEA